MNLISDLFADPDWRAAFAVADERNATPAYEKFTPKWRELHPGLEHVCAVLAYVEGERDGDSWAVVVSLEHPQSNIPAYALIESGCDYTGWTCQAGGSWTYALDLNDLKQFALTDELRDRLIWKRLQHY